MGPRLRGDDDYMMKIRARNQFPLGSEFTMPRQPANKPIQESRLTQC